MGIEPGATENAAGGNEHRKQTGGRLWVWWAARGVRSTIRIRTACFGPAMTLFLYQPCGRGDRQPTLTPVAGVMISASISSGWLISFLSLPLLALVYQSYRLELNNCHIGVIGWPSSYPPCTVNLPKNRAGGNGQASRNQQLAIALRAIANRKPLRPLSPV